MIRPTRGMKLPCIDCGVSQGYAIAKEKPNEVIPFPVDYPASVFEYTREPFLLEVDSKVGFA